MLLSFDWLAQHVDISDLTPAKLAELMTLHMGEVDGVTEAGGGWPGVRVAEVLKVRPHPNADKLRLVTVNDATTEIEVVCGAPNVAEGQRICFAPEGSVLPDGTKLDRREIRGVESAGMVLSERELGLSEEHEGILVLANDAPVGAPARDVLPGPMIEVDNNGITTRPDLWGHHGVAREIATIRERELRPLDLGPEFPGSEPQVSVEIANPELCSRYLGWVIGGIRVQPSPAWMQRRLEEAGQRSINNVVDLTNYILLECGQPIHAFDRRQIAGGKIIVRASKPGEKVVTLDGVERTLPENCCVIADMERAVAIAGVMGLANSEVQEDTTEIVLEVANFHNVATRRAAQALDLRTEAATRFEKGLDPEGVPVAARRFFQLLKEICPDATPVGGPMDARSAPEPQRVLRFAEDFIERRLGLEIPAARIDDILVRLGFQVERGGGEMTVTVPTWRAGRDVSLPEDIVEEVGRIHGYDRIVPRPLLAPHEPVPVEPEREARGQVRSVLSHDCGLTEVYTYPFTTESDCRKAEIEPGSLSLANAEQEGLDLLVTSLVPAMLKATAHNLKYRSEVGLYVVAPVFLARENELPHEQERVTIVLAERDREMLFSVKGIVENLTEGLGIAGVALRQDVGKTVERPGWLHPGRSASLGRGRDVFGWIGEVHPAVARAFDLDARVAIADLDLEKLRGARGRGVRMKPVSRFPTVAYDVAIVVDRRTPAGEVETALRKVDRKLVRGVRLFDVYEGKGIPDGKRSLAFTITFGAADRTLESADVERLQVATNGAIEKKGWALRA